MLWKWFLIFKNSYNADFSSWENLHQSRSAWVSLILYFMTVADTCNLIPITKWIWYSAFSIKVFYRSPFTKQIIALGLWLSICHWRNQQHQRQRTGQWNISIENIWWWNWKLFQSMMIHMYFAVMWLEPRLVINETAVEWDEDRTGPKDVRI